MSLLGGIATLGTALQSFQDSADTLSANVRGLTSGPKKQKSKLAKALSTFERRDKKKSKEEKQAISDAAKFSGDLQNISAQFQDKFSPQKFTEFDSNFKVKTNLNISNQDAVLAAIMSGKDISTIFGGIE